PVMVSDRDSRPDGQQTPSCTKSLQVTDCRWNGLAPRELGLLSNHPQDAAMASGSVPGPCRKVCCTLRHRHLLDPASGRIRFIGDRRQLSKGKRKARTCQLMSIELVVIKWITLAGAIPAFQGHSGAAIEQISGGSRQ